MNVAAACALMLLALSGCGGSGGEPELTTGPSIDGFAFTEVGGMHEGDRVPVRYTCDGEDVAPSLGWRGVPEGTKELGLVLEDPDAPGGTFTHWLVWDIEPSLSELRTGQRTGYGPEIAREGRNDFGKLGYGGPCPPGGQTHRYVFRLLALGEAVELDSGSDRSAFDAAVGSHVLAEARLTATYSRS